MPPAAEIQQVIGMAVIDRRYREELLSEKSRAQALQEVQGLDETDLKILTDAQGETLQEFADNVHIEMLKRPKNYSGLI